MWLTIILILLLIDVVEKIIAKSDCYHLPKLKRLYCRGATMLDLNYAQIVTKDIEFLEIVLESYSKAIDMRKFFYEDFTGLRSLLLKSINCPFDRISLNEVGKLHSLMMSRDFEFMRNDFRIHGNPEGLNGLENIHINDMCCDELTPYASLPSLRYQSIFCPDKIVYNRNQSVNVVEDGLSNIDSVNLETPNLQVIALKLNSYMIGDLPLIQDLSHLVDLQLELTMLFPIKTAIFENVKHVERFYFKSAPVDQSNMIHMNKSICSNLGTNNVKDIKVFSNTWFLNICPEITECSNCENQSMHISFIDKLTTFPNLTQVTELNLVSNLSIRFEDIFRHLPNLRYFDGNMHKLLLGNASLISFKPTNIHHFNIRFDICDEETLHSLTHITQFICREQTGGPFYFHCDRLSCERMTQGGDIDKYCLGFPINCSTTVMNKSNSRYPGLTFQLLLFWALSLQIPIN